MKFPTLSFIIATWNSGRTIERCLKSIKIQRYPKNNIEIIIVDGGSTDETLTVAEKYHARVFHKPGMTQEPAKGFGLARATGEYIVAIDSDNILPSPSWLMDLVEPLLLDATLTASYPLYYTYDKTMSLFNRCVALYGVNDPIPYFLGKADRQSYRLSDYALAGQAQDCGTHYHVEFTKENMPTLGANGFIIKTSLLKKARVDPEHFFHIDVIYDLVAKRHNAFAVVKTSIIHDTAITLRSLLFKRDRYFKAFYLLKKQKRRYYLIRPGEIWRPFLFALYSITLVGPLAEGVRGYVVIRDPAWFAFPIFCLSITFIYTEAMLRSWFLHETH